MSISSKHGKALDSSGAFAFAAATMIALIAGQFLLVVGCLIATLAFLCSFMAWQAREAYNDVGAVRWRKRCAFLAGIATAIILAAIIWGIFS